MAANRARRGILAGVGLFLAVVVLTEVGVREWAHHWRDPVERYDHSLGTFRLAPGRHTSSTGRVIEINTDGFPGPELAPSSAQLVRIVAVGDSSTYGGGSATNSYPALLQRHFDELATTSLRYEVVNAGIAGAHSGDALRRLTASVLPIHPDSVVIYIGWNDLTKFSPSAQESRHLRGRMLRTFEELWLVRGVKKLWFFYARPVLFTPKTGLYSGTNRIDDFSPLVFEQNLRKMVSLVRTSDADVLLATLPTPLRPMMSTDRIRERQIGFPYFSGADNVADFLDLIAAYNRTIRVVAHQEQATLIDLARDFEALPDATPYFWDEMHTNLNGRKRIAQRVFERLEYGEDLGFESP